MLLYGHWNTSLALPPWAINHPSLETKNFFLKIRDQLECHLHSTYISLKSSEYVSIPKYADSAHTSCAVTRKKIWVGVKFNPGNRIIPLLGPVNESNEWYAICMPPDWISKSMRLVFEKMLTVGGTHCMTFASKAFVIDRRISLAIDTPTELKCK